MDKQILKTTVTVEFAADETALAAHALTIIAAGRGDARIEGAAPSACKDNGSEPDNDPEPERPTRSRRSRKAADEAPARPRRAERNTDPEPGDDPDPEADARTTSAASVGRPKHQTAITHDDIRDLMAEVIEADEANRPKVLTQLNKVGAKSVRGIKEEHIEDFYEFLQELKDEAA